MKLEEIAKLAGVSVSTASVALSGKNGVSEKKRKHIMEVAKANNYQPLRDHSKNKATFTVHLVVCHSALIEDVDYFSLPIFKEIIDHFKYLSTQGKFNFTTHNLKVNTCVEELQQLPINSKGDWVIVYGVNLTTKLMETIGNQYSNLIFYENYNEKIETNFVCSNSYQAGLKTANYIANTTAKTVGFVSQSRFSDLSFNLTRGFKEGLKINNISLLRGHEFVVDGSGITNPFHESFELGDLPNILFCENPTVTANTIKFLMELGVTVGEDIGIIGMDSHLSTLPTDEQITSIGNTGTEIANVMINMFNQNTPISYVSLIPQLTIGGSTKNLNI